MIGGVGERLVEVVDGPLPLRGELIGELPTGPGRSALRAAPAGTSTASGRLAPRVPGTCGGQRRMRAGLHHGGPGRPMPRQHHGGGAVGAGGHAGDVDHRQMPVGADAIALPVAVLVRGGELVDHLDRDLRIGVADGIDDVVALDVDVLVDAVGDLQGEEGEADGAIVGPGRQPVGPVPAGQHEVLRHPPEAHVVTLGGGAADLLLVREVMASAQQVQVGDRGGRVGAAQHRGADHPPGRRQGALLSQHPAGPAHRHVHVLLGAVEGQVDGIGEHTLGGAGATEEVVGKIDPGHQLVQARQRDVGQQEPEAHQVQQSHRGQGEALDQVQQRQPDGDHHTGDDEQGVQQAVHLEGAIGGVVAALVVVDGRMLGDRSLERRQAGGTRRVHGRCPGQSELMPPS